MFLRCGWLTLTVCLALTVVEPARAEPPQRDCYGDPLPPGARVRLGTLRWRLPGGIRSIAFAPGGKTVVVAGDGTVRLWELATGRELRRFVANAGGESSAHFLGDGKTLVILSSAPYGKNRTLRLWDVAAWKELRRWKGPEDGDTCFKLSPDGKILARGDGRQGIRLQDAATGKELCRLAGVESNAALVFAPDGKTLATPDQRKKTIQLWDCNTGKKLRLLQGFAHFEYHPYELFQGLGPIRFAPDGTRLASTSDDRTIRIWDVQTGKELLRIGKPLVRYEDRRRATRVWSLLFSPDGKTLAITGQDDEIHLRSTTTGHLIRTFAGEPVSALVFSPSGKSLAAAGSRLRLLELGSGKDLLPHLVGHRDTIHLAAFLPGGKTVLTSADDSTLRVWDAATGKQLRRFRQPPGDLEVVALARDGQAVAVIGDEGEIAVAGVGRKGIRWRGKPLAIRCAAFAPDGNTLATGGFNGDVCLWDTATGKKFRRLGGHRVGASFVCFSPDGKLLASGGGDSHTGQGGRIVRIWDTATLRQVFQLGGHRHRVSNLAFSPDGRMLASVSRGDPIRLWEVATGRERGQVPVGDERVVALRFGPDSKALVFSPDSKLLAWSGGNVIRLWDLAGGKEVHCFRGTQGRMHSLDFSPDGRSLLAANADTTALIWTVGPFPKQAIPRPLTDRQQQALWDDLAGTDAVRAYRAILTLAAVNKQAVPFLRQQLLPEAATRDKLARLIADLDDTRFAVRRQATLQLKQQGGRARLALLRALQGRPFLETRQRLSKLLHDLKPATEELRCLRAVEVLEHVDTAPARELLRALKQELVDERTAQAANAALRRLDRPRVQRKRYTKREFGK